MILKYLFIVISWFVVILILVKKNKKLAVKVRWPIFLILAGTLANGFEIITKGYVFDYIDLKKIGIFWPVFNFADLVIVIGLFWLIFRIIRS